MNGWQEAKTVALEWVLQMQAEKRARERERDPQRARVVENCLRDADEHLEMLGDVSEPEVARVASPALREATLLLLRAAAVDELTLDSGPALARTCEQLGFSPASTNAARRLFETTDPLALADWSDKDLVASALALDEIARALRSHVDGRTVQRVVSSRRRRVALVVALVVYVLVETGSSLFARKNVAFGKNVVLSSVDRSSAPPSMLVDGVRSADTPPGSPKPDVVYTQHESNPWALVDLGREYSVHEVLLYNRDDGSFDDGLPYIVDFSFDDRSF
ncbi:MAG TPA: hypothetical protein VGH28_24520 [Polyangiaceae bacterium]